MQVWILSYHDYDDVSIEGAYDSFEAAEHARKTMRMGRFRDGKRHCLSVSEWELESLPPELAKLK